ncbi:ABC transporter permease [Granulicoccus phenolivorans]|uniref:ABC transporter permease n=1 Tax=Granulicoccus phenolivorans TaxID=266854 RepID=UPI000421C5B4|nr:ABC transporter permease [Granulicoccus phenolivorans]
MKPATRARRRLLEYLPLAPGGLFLIALFVVPLVSLFVLSLRPIDAYYEPLPGFSPDNYRTVFTTAYFSGALGYTLRMALIVTVVCAVLAFPVAWVLSRSTSKVFRMIATIVVVSPLLTSVVVRSFGWRALLAADGLVNGLLTGIGVVERPLNLLSGPVTVVVVVVHVLLPFAVVTLATSLGRIDDSLLRASASMGARPVRTFGRVVLPLSLPGLLSGAIIVFSLSMGIYVTPMLVGGANQPLAGLRVYDLAMRVFNRPGAAALSFVLFAISLLVILVLSALGRAWDRRLHD